MFFQQKYHIEKVILILTSESNDELKQKIQKGEIKFQRTFDLTLL